MRSQKNLKRSDFVLSTKVFWGGKGPNDRGLSRKHVFEGMVACLQRLQLDYVDIVYAQRPGILREQQACNGKKLRLETGRSGYAYGGDRESVQLVYRQGHGPVLGDKRMARVLDHGSSCSCQQTSTHCTYHRGKLSNRITLHGQ